MAGSRSRSFSGLSRPHLCSRFPLPCGHPTLFLPHQSLHAFCRLVSRVGRVHVKLGRLKQLGEARVGYVHLWRRGGVTGWGGGGGRTSVHTPSAVHQNTPARFVLAHWLANRFAQRWAGGWRMKTCCHFDYVCFYASVVDVRAGTNTM